MLATNKIARIVIVASALLLAALLSSSSAVETDFKVISTDQFKAMMDGMKRNVSTLINLFCVLVLMPLPAFAADYVKPDVLKQWLVTGKTLVIVDIQPAEDFADHHFKGSIETNAFPAKTDEEKKLIDIALPLIRASKDNIVIVCPRGKSGAGNTYEHLKSLGIAESRLFILEGGTAGWPYPELLVKGK